MVNLSQTTLAVSFAVSFGYTIDEGDINYQAQELMEDGKVNLGSVLDHGCWCSRLGSGPNSDNNKPGTRDGIDQLCKQWFQARRCITLEGGACEGESANGYEFNAGRVDPSNSGNPVSNCAKDQHNNSPCGVATCQVDAHYAREIWSAVLASGSTPGTFSATEDLNCEQVTLIPRENLMCTGTTPHVKAVEKTNYKITIHPGTTGYAKIYWQLKDKTTGAKSKLWISQNDNDNNGAGGTLFDAGDEYEGYIDVDQFDIEHLRVRYPNGVPTDKPLLFKAEAEGVLYKYESDNGTRNHEWTWVMHGNCDTTDGTGCPVVSAAEGAYNLDNHCDNQQRCSLKP